MTIHRARILQRFAFSKRVPEAGHSDDAQPTRLVEMGNFARVKRANLRSVFDFFGGPVVADLVEEIEVSITG
ncbi:hypothetical protein [Saccharopolyspora shandongensis]|uniref:hypothetical protein n=1 Tax=Saccharopolyspora shandongensis TaxID=418495 RepID=UPI00115F85C3|nr:hypothetical protein [Saccharopolyspora shandongensis]